MDNLTKEQRKYNMSRIRSLGTNLEENFFKLLEKNKLSYTKHPKIFGKPDCQIGDNLLVFVDSDFWHGWHFSEWRNRLPTNYWSEKIEGNLTRDRRKFKKLRKQGYKVIRIWEHQLKNENKVINKLKVLM